MTIHTIDPMTDPRWDTLVGKHPKASVFHAATWLRSIRDTYGHESLALTTCSPNESLTSALVLCRVKSWITGNRIVSLPFADHCDPLTSSEEETANYLHSLAQYSEEKGYKYVELRPTTALSGDLMAQDSFSGCAGYAFHTLDLEPAIDELWRGLHHSCIRRKVQRARRESLVTEWGRNERLLGMFYQLMVETRRRHQLPPQPIHWFRSLIRNYGDDAVLWVASREERPVAAILTIAGSQAVVYKYGCSSAQDHNLGGMPLLFWHAIEYAKARGARIFDFGRSDLDNPGLIAFKGHWGTKYSTLTYYRNGQRSMVPEHDSKRLRMARHLFARFPESCLVAAGRILYKHMG
jgi:hypothetical protein